MFVDEVKTIVLNKNEDDTYFVEITYKRKRLNGKNIEERSESTMEIPRAKINLEITSLTSLEDGSLFSFIVQ